MKIDDIKLYHGTTTDNWNPKSDMGYIYVTTNIEHARYHARDRLDNEKTEGIDSNMQIIMLKNECLSNFKLLPDNDINEVNGYDTWEQSLKEIGTIILVGDTRNLEYLSKIEKEAPSKDFSL